MRELRQSRLEHLVRKSAGYGYRQRQAHTMRTFTRTMGRDELLSCLHGYKESDSSRIIENQRP